MRPSPTLLLVAWTLACGSGPTDPLRTTDDFCQRDFACLGFDNTSQCVDFVLEEREANADLGCERHHDRVLECILDNPQPCGEWGRPSECDKPGAALDRCRE